MLENAQSHLVLPAIAFAESVWIVRNSKKSAVSVDSLLECIDRDQRIEIYPLNKWVVERTVQLSTIKEMHDRQIVATALTMQFSGDDSALITCDRNITESKLVPIIW